MMTAHHERPLMLLMLLMLLLLLMMLLLLQLHQVAQPRWKQTQTISRTDFKNRLPKCQFGCNAKPAQ